MTIHFDSEQYHEHTAHPHAPTHAGRPSCGALGFIGPAWLRWALVSKYMKPLKRVCAGVLALAFGTGALYLALGSYKAGRDLAPVTGPMTLQDYATVLALGGLGLAFLAVAYACLLRKRRA